MPNASAGIESHGFLAYAGKLLVSHLPPVHDLIDLLVWLASACGQGKVDWVTAGRYGMGP